MKSVSSLISIALENLTKPVAINRALCCSEVEAAMTLNPNIHLRITTECTSYNSIDIYLYCIRQNHSSVGQRICCMKVSASNLGISRKGWESLLCEILESHC